MSKKTINVGTTPNDGTGDKLNVAFGKINDNFTELYNGKENALPDGSFDQVLRGDRTFSELAIADIGALQSTLDNKVDEGDITTTGITQNGAGLLGRTTGSTAAAIQRLSSTQVKTFLALDAVDNTSDLDKPLSTAATTALSGKEPSLPTGGAGQYLRGDKTFQDLNKTAVGLSNVENTADKDKPVFTATVNGIVKAPGATDFTSGAKFLASDGTWKEAAAASGGVTSVNNKTGVVTLAKGDIGLGNVDNTSDVNKPVSTAQQSAIDLKEDKISAAASAPLTKYWRGDKTFQVLNKAAVGLDQVDNTADADKPVSTATQTALDLKADKSALVRSVGFFFRNAAAMNSSSPVVEVVRGGFTAVIANCVAKAKVANTTDVTFGISKNGTNIGTVTFLADATTGTISIPTTTDRNFAVGDYIEVIGPVSGVDNMVGMTVVLRN